MVSRGQIPEIINSQKLLKDLSKEIRHAERFLIALNPPKPERESKRKKRKPINKDFVDFNKVDRITDCLKIKSPLKENPLKIEIPTVKETSAIIPRLKLTLPKPTMKSPINDIIAKELKDNFNSTKTIKTLSPKVAVVKKAKMDDSKSNKIMFHSKTTNSKKSKTIILTDGTRNIKLGKQSPTVIRFKLGDKEVVRSTQDKGNNIYGNFTLGHELETRKELTWKQTTSIYDFHDGSNESDSGFTIDEAPKRKKNQKSSVSPKKIKRKLESEGTEQNGVPKNGIEELIKASVYTLDGSTSRTDLM